MRVLLIIAHGCEDASSHSHKLAAIAKDALLAAHNEVRVLDLMKAGFGVTLSKRDFVGYDESKPFKPVMYQNEGKLCQQIKDAQKSIEWATHVVIFGPMWFYRLPAIFESFLERVFSAGWAYDYNLPADKMPLSGKKFMIVITAGGSIEDYGVGKGASGIEGFLFSTTYGLHSMGIKMLKTIPVYSVDGKSEEEWAATCQRFHEIILNLDSREEIPYDDPKFHGQDYIITAAQDQNEGI